MTTLRRMLQATAQGDPLPEGGPSRTDNISMLHEDSELHFNKDDHTSEKRMTDTKESKGKLLGRHITRKALGPFSTGILTGEFDSDIFDASKLMRKRSRDDGATTRDSNVGGAEGEGGDVRSTTAKKLATETEFLKPKSPPPPPPPSSPPPPPPPPPQTPIVPMAKKEPTRNLVSGSGGQLSSGTGKSKSRSSDRDGEDEDDDHDNADELDKLTWVQCEKCQKWRDIPSYVSAKLPNEWYCSLNHWDPDYANCEAPQKDAPGEEIPSVQNGAIKREKVAPQDSQTSSNAVLPQDRPEKELANGKKKKKRLSKFEAEQQQQNSNANQLTQVPNAGLRRGNKKLGAASTGGPSKAKKGKFANSGSQASPSASTKPSRPTMSAMMMSSHNAPNGKGKSGKKCDWVMCEKCQQWRKLPPEVDPLQLPEKWYCNMNHWDEARANCSVPQEEDETQAEQEEGPDASDGRNSLDRSTDGVSIIGGQFIKGGRKAPMSYRDLINNHHRHFPKYDGVANNVLNVRYHESSLFVPRGTLRTKGVKKTASEKGQAAVPSTNISHSTRANRGISNAAIIYESTFRKLFHLGPIAVGGKTTGPAAQSVVSHRGISSVTLPLEEQQSSEPGSVNNQGDISVERETNGKTDLSVGGVSENLRSDFNFLEILSADDNEDRYNLPTSLLRVSKPWQKVGGWIGDANYYCVRK